MKTNTGREQIFWYEDPDLSYETDEFIVERDPLGQFFYGNDGGCSCYEGFDPANFTGTFDIAEVQRGFSEWVKGIRNPAPAWEEFKANVR
jgi:hypothetical protein